MRKARWMRRILGIVLGVVAALGILMAIEALAHFLYPAPAFDTLNRAELATSMAAIPLPAKGIVALGWLASAFGGAWLALRVCDWRWAGWIVAALVVAGNIANLIALPHPFWMQALALLLPLLGGALAQRAHHKPYRGEPLLG